MDFKTNQQWSVKVFLALWSSTEVQSNLRGSFANKTYDSCHKKLNLDHVTFGTNLTHMTFGTGLTVGSKRKNRNQSTQTLQAIFCILKHYYIDGADWSIVLGLYYSV